MGVKQGPPGCENLQPPQNSGGQTSLSIYEPLNRQDPSLSPRPSKIPDPCLSVLSGADWQSEPSQGEEWV